MAITPDNTLFVVLCFEGPDVYAMAGGLGARITHLTRTLADLDFTVHHFFIGDPAASGVETLLGGKLILHRWCQWISRYHPGGVYDGEEDKRNDYLRTVPPYVIEKIIAPAQVEKKMVVILGEEWQTAEILSRFSDQLWNEGLRRNTVLFWNANNTYSFERIDWSRLKRSATMTTVSKYMKQIMLKMGINSFVIPNGIEKSLTKEVPDGVVSKIRSLVGADLLLSKVARWHRDKGWEPAIETIEKLKSAGRKPVLLARGSSDAYGKKITREAEALGIRVSRARLEGDPKEIYDRAEEKRDFRAYYQALSKAGPAEILNLDFPVPHCFLRAIYRASDIVLANSIHEPFGLVGLEAMASGAVVFTGCSGEDYAIHLNNAIVLDTFNADEIEYYINFLQAQPLLRKSITAMAKKTARRWIWEEVVKELICKLEYQARIQGIDLPDPEAAAGGSAFSNPS